MEQQITNKIEKLVNAYALLDRTANKPLKAKLVTRIRELEAELLSIMP